MRGGGGGTTPEQLRGEPFQVLGCLTPFLFQNFGAPSFDDKKLEVVAVFGSIQMAVSRVINLQHHRIAQVRRHPSTWLASLVLFLGGLAVPIVGGRGGEDTLPQPTPTFCPSLVCLLVPDGDDHNPWRRGSSGASGRGSLDPAPWGHQNPAQEPCPDADERQGEKRSWGGGIPTRPRGCRIPAKLAWDCRQD